MEVHPSLSPSLWFSLGGNDIYLGHSFKRLVSVSSGKIASFEQLKNPHQCTERQTEECAADFTAEEFQVFPGKLVVIPHTQGSVIGLWLISKKKNVHIPHLHDIRLPFY